MWSVSRDFGLFVGLALRLHPRVTAFHATYELSRWLRRRLASPRQQVAPTALYLETSSFCRGRCDGCYVPVRDRKEQLRLSDSQLEDALATARRLRPDWICIVGGEPLDPSILDVNLAMIRGAPELRFLLCTGAHGRCDPALMRTLAGLPNLTVIFSVDGFAGTHDRIHGAGSHERIRAALRSHAASRGRICGASITLRRDNWREVTSPAFLASLALAGCQLLSYDPWFSDRPGEELAPDELASAITRLQTGPARGSVVFVNPFGHLRRDGFEPRSAMTAAAIDYRGNVYGSRRGAPLGSVKTQPLGTILAGEAFQRGCRAIGRGGYAVDDPRAPLFEATLARLAR